jgi:hypothetical protein
MTCVLASPESSAVRSDDCPQPRQKAKLSAGTTQKVGSRRQRAKPFECIVNASLGSVNVVFGKYANDVNSSKNSLEILRIPGAEQSGQE